MQKTAYGPRETAFSLTLSSQPDTLPLIQVGISLNTLGTSTNAITAGG